jgi:hypothetical protein
MVSCTQQHALGVNFELAPTGIYKYVLVCTKLYLYVLVCIVYLWVEVMVELLQHVDWVTSGTHHDPEALGLPFETEKC